MRHLYISYPPHDYELAHRLVDDLQAAGYAVFVDAVSSAGTMPWAAETRRAIRTSGAVLMILDRRRVGIRHEGVLARRTNRPTFVLARSDALDLPRYLSTATLIDFSGDYETGRDHLLAALPDAATLLNDPGPVRRRRVSRPAQHRHQRRITWGIALGVVLVLCLLVGIATGLIPV